MDMSIPYELSGRREQKARTRAALITAARELLADGVTPTVEQAADAALVSRTTAYRYFPNQRALLLGTYPEIELSSLVDADASDDPIARVDGVVEELTRQVLEHEPELRTMLRLSLEPDPPPRSELPFRRGKRIEWVDDALAPLRGKLPEPELRRLSCAIGAVIGIEALVWLTDMAELSRDEAMDVMRWSARTLLQSAIGSP